MSLFRRYVLRHWPLKLLAVLLSTGLWVTITREPVVEIGYSVPIEFHHVPENLVITSLDLPEAHIRLRGPAGLVRAVEPSEVRPSVDLEDAKPGERTYDLDPGDIDVPYPVEVVQVVPSQFRLSLERRRVREVRIDPRVVGGFVSGFEILNVTAEPGTATIVGPETRVVNVESALTDPIDATGVVGKATFRADVYVTDPLVQVLKPKTVTVIVETGKKTKSAEANTGP